MLNMKQARIIFLYFTYIVALLYFCVHLKLDQATQGNQKLPCVLCTTTIIYDTVKNIAQDKLCVTMLMSEGVDPHLYKPTTQDVAKIDQAQIIFYNGLHLEARMADIFENMQYKTCTIAISKDIPRKLLIASSDNKNYHDPHIWFDIELWMYTIETIRKTLCEKFPENKLFFTKQANLFKQKLVLLHEENKKILHKIPKEKRSIITGHDAFSYFARAYNFQVVSLQGISTECEAGAHDIISLATYISAHDIPTIFVETSISPKNIQALAEAVHASGGKVEIGQELFSDSLGALQSQAGSYIGMFRHNTHAIAQGLSLK